ncbi:MAG: undecaprenyl-diphosphate phosphatase, partial [Planctomycetota bacterium]
TRLLKAALLGLVQGLTEFLPVSSSGHLALLQAALDWKDADSNLAFNVVVHLGSLAAVLIFVRREIVAMFTTEKRLLFVLALGTVPLAVIGVGAKDAVKDLSSNLAAVGGFLLCTAGFLALAERLQSGDGRASRLSWQRALVVGLAQAAAIFPGISRSGTTLVGGLASGLEREQAVRLSFLLAIPAIAGAGLFTALDGGNGSTVNAGELIVGAVVSFVASLIAMRLLMVAAVRHKLRWFATYCAVIGSAAIVLTMFG